MKFALIGNHTPEWIARPEERGRLAHARSKELGLRVIASYYTQGPLDFITVIDAPDAETASRFSIWYAAQGVGRVQTLRAFTSEEMAQITAEAGAGGSGVRAPAAGERESPIALDSALEAPVFEGYSQSALDREYNPRLAVANFAAITDEWAERSARTRGGVECTLDVRYGESEAERLDILRAATPSAPIHIFFHGGYWRSGDKSDVSFVAQELLKAGATVVVPNYALCPDVKMDELLRQCYRAIRWVRDNARDLGGDPARIHLAGHSAGAHIVAMAMTEGKRHGIEEGAVRSGLAISGLYNLEPLRRSFLNLEVRLDQDQVRGTSPIGLVRPTSAVLTLAVGEVESREFHRQTTSYCEAWRKAGNRVELITVPGADHYSVLDALVDPEAPLCQAAIAHLRRQAQSAPPSVCPARAAAAS